MSTICAKSVQAHREHPPEHRVEDHDARADDDAGARRDDPVGHEFSTSPSATSWAATHPRYEATMTSAVSSSTRGPYRRRKKSPMVRRSMR